MPAPHPYNALVIGGGINGLCALAHLQRLGCKPVGLIEQFRLGHTRSSSHGDSRITRSAYVDARYVRLMQIAHGLEWPRLERDTGQTLIHRTLACFFGVTGGKFDKYAQAVAEVGVDVERLTPNQARRRFPQFRFENVAGALHDRTAGLIAADRTRAALAGLIRKNGADILEETRVLDIDPSRTPVRLNTTRGPLETERLILTAGPWAARLLPFLGPHLTVKRQTVGYARLSGPPEDFRLGRFPVWGYLGREGVIFYGLPEFGREGVKLARHITSGAPDDPDHTPENTAPEALEDLAAFIKTHFVAPLERFVGSETCYYTNTATEDFILDRHPQNPNILIGAGFTGHGFKLGPITGRILAELAVHGTLSLPEFRDAQPLFKLK